jgi:hypothetical protein
MRLVISKPATELSPAGAVAGKIGDRVGAPVTVERVVAARPESVLALVLPMMMLPELLPVPVVVLGNKLRFSSPEPSV